MVGRLDMKFTGSKSKTSHVIGIAVAGKKEARNECKGAYESPFSKVYQEPTFNGN